MNKFPLRILWLLALSTLAVAWVIQRRSETQMRKECEDWRPQLAELAPLKAENERLSNSIAQPGDPLANDQLEELLRLRREVELLRTQTNEVRAMRDQNEALRAAQLSAQHPPVGGHAWIPLDTQSLAFAGFATPEATMQSFLRASADGDIKSLRASYTDDLRSRVEEQEAAGKLQTEIGSSFANEFPGLAGMQILKEEPDPASRRSAFVVLINSEDPKLLRVEMQNVNSTWRIAGMSHEPNSIMANR